MTMLEHSPQIGLLPMELPSMSSPGDSRAKTLAFLESKQDSAKEREADCGVNAYDLLASYDPDTQSLRTSQTCFLGLPEGRGLGLAEYSQTWPSSGMMRNGTVYQLPMLVPGIDGTEFGYLPTPTKSDAKGSPKNRYFRSPTSHGNLCEVLRDGPDDPIYPHPDFVTQMMGFPMGHTELPPLATLWSLKYQNL
jgi:hypothetical protein